MIIRTEIDHVMQCIEELKEMLMSDLFLKKFPRLNNESDESYKARLKKQFDSTFERLSWCHFCHKELTDMPVKYCIDGVEVCFDCHNNTEVDDERK